MTIACDFDALRDGIMFYEPRELPGIVKATAYVALTRPDGSRVVRIAGAVHRQTLEDSADRVRDTLEEIIVDFLRRACERGEWEDAVGTVIPFIAIGRPTDEDYANARRSVLHDPK